MFMTRGSSEPLGLSVGDHIRVTSGTAWWVYEVVGIRKGMIDVACLETSFDRVGYVVSYTEGELRTWLNQEDDTEVQATVILTDINDLAEVWG